MLEHTNTTLAECQPGDLWVKCEAAKMTEQWFGSVVVEVIPARQQAVHVNLKPSIDSKFITKGITARGSTPVEVLRPVQDGEAN